MRYEEKSLVDDVRKYIKQTYERKREKIFARDFFAPRSRRRPEKNKPEKPS